MSRSRLFALASQVLALLVLAVASLGLSPVPAQAAESVLYPLGLHSNDGANLQAGVARAADGTVYGVAYAAPAGGVLFKIAPNGTYTSLHVFGNGLTGDGYAPYGTPLLASDGKLYGTTYVGGSGGCGVVWTYDPVTQLYAVLYGFTGGTSSCNPASGLIEGSDGNLYGTTLYGGNFSARGTAYKLTKAGAYTLLASFPASNSTANGYYPYAPLVQGSDGNLYGTLSNGGNANNSGTLFKLTTTGTLTRLGLMSGNGTGNGTTPYGALAEGSSGVFYGVANSGGANGAGTVFKVTTTGTPVITRLYSFTGVADGCNPQGGMTLGGDGNFYGITTNCAKGYGTVFKITPAGALTTLHGFDYAAGEGAKPINGYAGMLLGSDGNFYGATVSGGNASYAGTVFSITPAGVLTTLFTVNDPTTSEGRAPDSGIAQGSDGNFYGTTTTDAQGYGTVFKLTPAGVLSPFYNFGSAAGANGSSPVNILTPDALGNFYGTAPAGGAHGAGTVFKLTSAGVASTLYSFGANSLDGANPQAPLLLGSDGNYYGTTFSGGNASNQGEFYSISPAGSYSKRFVFNGTGRGQSPSGRLVQSGGSFYGTTQSGGANSCGAVYQFTPPSTVNRLYSFACGADGYQPIGGLVAGTDGNFYGTTYLAGTGFGTVFIITPGGALTTLHGFDYNNDGGYPFAPLVLAGDGNFYGTTSQGGGGDGSKKGTAFRITPKGAFSVLATFAGQPDGDTSHDGLIQASDGNLYGTTTLGGLGFGTVVKLDGPAHIPQNPGASRNDGSVSLSWDASLLAATYNVYRGTTPGGEAVAPVATGLGGTSTTISGLTNDQPYYFTVTAVNGVGETQPSAEVGATPKDLAPDSIVFTPVSNAALNTQYTSNTVTISGLGSGANAPVSITGGLYSKNSGGFTNAATTANNGDTFATQVTSSSTTFTNQTAQLSVGSGVGVFSVTTGNGLLAPANVSAVRGNAQVTVSWTASAGATSYNIYQGTTAGGEGANPVKTGVTGTSTAVTGLTNGTTYFFKVAAVNASGISPLSAEVSAKPAATPLAPTNVTAVPGSGKVTLSWTASTGATSYNVYQGTSPGGEAAAPVKSGSAHSVAITGLSNGTTYYFNVVAVNASGASPPSAEVSAKPAPVPTVPTGVSAIGGDTQVNLSWNASTGASTYSVFQGTTAGGEGTTAVKTNIAAASTAITGLSNGTQYFFKIVAVNSSGSSAKSAEVNATPVNPPAPPANVAASAGNAQAGLSWTASAGATSYNVYKGSAAGGEATTPVQTGITATSTTVTGLNNGTTYYFKVAALTGASTSPLSAEVSAKPLAPPAAPTGVSATPGAGKVTLSWNASTGATSYSVYQGTTSGGEAATPVKTGTARTVAISGLTKGVTYFFTVTASSPGGASPNSAEVSATAQ